MTTYLIPTSFTSRQLPLEYRISQVKKDMRTRFCKIHKDHEIDPEHLEELIEKYQPKIKGDRVIMINGKLAYSFFKSI